MKLRKNQLRNLILKEMKSVINEMDPAILDPDASGFVQENFDMFIKMHKVVFDEAERIADSKGFAAAAMYLAFEIPGETISSISDVLVRGDLLENLSDAYSKDGFDGLAVAWYKTFWLEYDFKQK